jgi:hypothetical protein
VKLFSPVHQMFNVSRYVSLPYFWLLPWRSLINIAAVSTGVQSGVQSGSGK